MYVVGRGGPIDFVFRLKVGNMSTFLLLSPPGESFDPAGFWFGDPSVVSRASAAVFRHSEKHGSRHTTADSLP